MRKKLINKDALMAEIESIEYETNYEPFTDEVLGKRKVCKDIKDFLDTLEVKEEILDESAHEAFKSGYDMGVLQTTNKMNHNMKNVDLIIHTIITECCDWLAICTDLSHDLIEDCRNLMLAIKDEQFKTQNGN